MRVNSSVAIVILAIFSITSSFRNTSDHNLLSKEVNIIIRDIGHRLLLQAGDSTSRVLPVTETEKRTFLLRFEKKLNFSHDSLQLLSKELLPQTKFTFGYAVTVHDCTNGEIVYGFEVNNKTPDVLPCMGRNQPGGCYTMEFAFRDLYKKIEEEVAAKPGSLKATTFNYTLNNVVYAGALALLVAAFLIWRLRKNLKPVSGQNQHIIKESIPELPSLGKFLFNGQGQRLLLGSEEIGLTDKECKVLELLHKNFGELVPRETLMQEVWINEGVITGRSLDMFVSKLRKKLSRDPALRITNVHGKGYKLEIIHPTSPVTISPARL